MKNFVLMAENDGEGSDLDGAEGEVVGTGNDARIAALNKIGQQAEDERVEELADANDDGTTTPFVVHDETDDEPADDESTHETPPRDATDDSKDKTYTIKVNGVERAVTIEELIASAQKVEAADAYLEDARETKRKAQAQFEAARVAQEQQQVDDDLALARAIQMGTEEEAVAAIRQITSRAATIPSTDEVVRTVEAKLTFNGAIEKFRNDFPDIITDPYLDKLAKDMDADLISKGDVRPYNERYTAIGNDIRKWVGKFRGDESPAQSGKQVRKAQATQAPNAAGGKSASSIVEEKEEAVSDTIAAIAKARGGPQWMSGMK